MSHKGRFSRVHFHEMMLFECNFRVISQHYKRPWKGFKKYGYLFVQAASCSMKQTGPYYLSLVHDSCCAVFLISKETVNAIYVSNEVPVQAEIELKDAAHNPSYVIYLSEDPPDESTSEPMLSRFIVLLREILAGGEDDSVGSLRDEMRLWKKNYQCMMLKEKSPGLTARTEMTIESRLFEVMSLERLDLSKSNLGESDTFNTDFLAVSQLKNLKILRLAENRIKSISDDLWRALPDGLKLLDLSCNEITYLSPCCARFPQLTDFLLSRNNIEGLPENLNKLINLKYLEVGWNKLTSISPEILPFNLETIGVTGNEGVAFSLAYTNKKPLAKVGSLFEYAAATLLNNNISVDALSKLSLPDIRKAAVKCTLKESFDEVYYPASMAVIRYEPYDWLFPPSNDDNLILTRCFEVQ